MCFGTSVTVTGGAWSYFCLRCVFSKRLLLHLFTHDEEIRVLECDQVRILEFPVCSIGADMMRMPSGDTADSKAMVCTPFGMR